MLALTWNILAAELFPKPWNKLPANLRGNGKHAHFKKLLKIFSFLMCSYCRDFYF